MIKKGTFLVSGYDEVNASGQELAMGSSGSPAPMRRWDTIAGYKKLKATIKLRLKYKSYGWYPVLIHKVSRQKTNPENPKYNDLAVKLHITDVGPIAYGVFSGLRKLYPAMPDITSSAGAMVYINSSEGALVLANVILTGAPIDMFSPKDPGDPDTWDTCYVTIGGVVCTVAYLVQAP